MPAGRPPKPVEQKRALGNPGKRPLPEQHEVAIIPAASNIPEPPRPLLKYGMQLWERIWEMGHSWISPQSDIELLLVTCECIDERWNLRVKVMQTDDARLRRGLRELDRLIVSNLSLLGFSPTDRSRLGLAEVRSRSAMDELEARREARQQERLG